MKKTATLAALALTVSLAAPREAEACSCNGDCPPLLDGIAYLMLAGIVGSYAYGAGYFIKHDLEGGDHSREYLGGELALHGTLGALFGGATVSLARDGNAGSAAFTGALTVMHGALAYHGAKGLWHKSGDLDLPKPSRLKWDDVKAPLGTVYAANTLIWLAMTPGEHGRNYGIAEAVVNAPFAAGLGYLAIDRARNGSTGTAIAYGALAAVSGHLTMHGIRTALNPAQPKALDLMGTDIMPTVVDDGVNSAAGIGASGTF